MESITNFGVLQVLILDLAALATIFGYFHMRDKNKQDRMDDRFRRVDDKVADLAMSCLRRDELKDFLEPIRKDVGDIRMSHNEILKLLHKLNGN